MAFQNIDHYKEKAKYSEKMYMAMGEPVDMGLKICGCKGLLPNLQ